MIPSQLLGGDRTCLIFPPNPKTRLWTALSTVTGRTMDAAELSHFARDRRKLRGFTLIELMIVMFIIVTLVSIAAPAYSRAVVTAKETVLHQDLYHLRQAIDE